MDNPAPFPDVYFPLAQKYGEQLPQQVAYLEELWEKIRQGQGHAEDATTLCRIVHNIIGSSATFGFDMVPKIARLLKTRLDPLPEVSGEDQEMLGAFLLALRIVVTVELEEMTSRPIPISEIPSPVQAPPSPLIFLADPEVQFAQALAEKIAPFGYTVRVFSRPAELLEATRVTPPAAILLEAVFPEGEQAGTEVAAEIQRLYKRSIPILFVSSHQELSVRLAALRAGGHEYFSKPVGIKELVSSLALLTGHHQQEDPYRILVVDDEPILAEQYALFLQQAGLLAEVVTDPLQVMDFLNTSTPDLVVLDIHMPGCNGLELAELIRQHKPYAALPLVFLSSATASETSRKVREAGADDFLEKPISFDELILAVTTRARRFRQLQTQKEQEKRRMESRRILERQQSSLASILQEEEKRRKEAEARQAQLEYDIQKLQREREAFSQIAQQEELAPGTVLLSGQEEYEIQGRLGSGGMSVTYWAVRRSDEKAVVIKALLPALMGDAKTLMRFLQEAHTILALEHENLVQGYDFYQGLDFSYLVMEFVRGKSIEALLHERSLFTPREATQIVHGVAQGLAYLEAHHLVHRDIKPANIIIGASGVVKLVDFGIAKMTDRDCALTTQGIILGTPHYISPEAIYQVPMDIRSDIYSLGATYYHMVIGQVPFTGDNAMEVIQERLISNPKPRRANPHLPTAIAALIEKMMNRNIKKRQSSAAALVAELESVLARLPSSQ